jgi:hypothetical protein
MRATATDIELRPRGAPPPAPPRSFLAERGEFDCASTDIELRPQGAPSPGLSPKKDWGRGDALRRFCACETRPTACRSALEFSPSPAQRGRGPGGGGPVGRSSVHVDEPQSVRNPTSPSLFGGRCEPKRAEGALRRTLRSAFLLLLASAVFSLPTAAQTADTVAVLGMRVDLDTVTVGDRFRAAVFVRAPAGARVELIVPPSGAGHYQVVDSVRVYPPDSARLHRAVATMVLWVTDPASSARAETRVTLADGAVRTVPIQLPLPFVRSVLPADSAQPRPPKDIIPNRRRRGVGAARALVDAQAPSASRHPYRSAKACVGGAGAAARVGRHRPA